ncbi:MAG: response regulator, partial [Rhodobacteraceae bacterium]|nr:response regulator [Paracoccaceae bacterium]
DLPERIRTDAQRLEQIIKNLISNAIKFTDEGRISVTFSPPARGVDLSRSGLDARRALAIAVTDTGIGIPPDKQLDIFEAFQQADGSTSRKYGGTGLGLSISRELTKLLGGEIHLQSTPGKGATFTLYLPLETGNSQLERFDSAHQARHPERSDVLSRSQGRRPQSHTPEIRNPKSEIRNPYVPDDRDILQADDHAILVIEDDPNFAKILRDQCRAKGCKCLVAETGEDGLHLVQSYPVQAIVLDLKLPGIDGWVVLDTL